MNKDQQFLVACKNWERHLELAQQEYDKMIELMYNE